MDFIRKIEEVYHLNFTVRNMTRICSTRGRLIPWPVIDYAFNAHFQAQNPRI